MGSFLAEFVKHFSILQEEVKDCDKWQLSNDGHLLDQLWAGEK